ncbi:hypothetical protein LDENG_00079950 [Lucifuga dentata]|nr:hypothetical protein LDENG_00079950 [Lucifuga dentata]
MKLSAVHPVFWSSLLVLWASKSDTEAGDSDLCHDELLPINDLEVLSSSGEDDVVVDEDFSCFLYPTNTLTCSWSSPTSQNDSQISFFVIVCEKNKALNYSSEKLQEEGVRSKSVVLCQDCIDYKWLYVIFLYNVSLHNNWTVYAFKYDTKHLEVLAPPMNISASVEDGGLLVEWSQPHTRVELNPRCFDYQLDIDDQERPKILNNKLQYTEPNADPTHTYRVRMRTKTSYCSGSDQWSEWSHTVTVAPTESVYKVNILVIIMISLGVPMILLAVLLVIRHQRVSKLLFPPIPHPPAKYKNFLEKNDTLVVHYPIQSPKYEEEITEVEDAEQNPEKTS